MASKPYPDKRRGTWHCKYKPDPKGPWVVVCLGKNPAPFGAKGPPKKPPQFAIDRRNEFAEIEYRAKRGLAKAPAKEKSLAAYVATFLEIYALSHDASSIKQMRRNAGLFLAFAAKHGATTVQGVTKAICRDYLESRAVAGIGHGTMSTEKGYLSGIWSRAITDQLVDVNPWQGVAPPGEPPEREYTFWSNEEVDRIAKGCAKSWQSDLVWVLANTGVRISAGLAMEWKWIDWSRGLVKVPAEHSKSGRSYSIPMTTTARDVLTRRLANLRETSDLVFPNPTKGGGPVSYATARSAIMKAIERAKVERGTPHDLRHTFARWLVRQPGIPLNVIQAALGHADLKTTQIYLTVDGDDLAGAFDNIGLGGEVEPIPASNPTPDTPASSRHPTA